MRAVRPTQRQRILAAALAVTALAITLAAGVATASRSTVGFPKPKVYRTLPKLCGRSIGGDHTSAGAPGLTATFVASDTVVVHWTVARPTEADCRTWLLYVSVGKYSTWRPTTVRVDTTGKSSGSVRFKSSFVARADTAIASAIGTNKLEGPLAGVLIRR